MKRLSLVSFVTLVAACDSASQADANGALAVSAVEPIECAWGSVDFVCATAVVVNVTDTGHAKRLIVAVDTDSLEMPIAASVEIAADAIGEHRVALPEAHSAECVPGLGLAHAVSARLEASPGDVIAEDARWNLEVEVRCD